MQVYANEGIQLPPILCLCGSTRFSEAFRRANLQETLAGNIVLSVGCDTKGDDDLFADMPQAERVRIKARLDVLHLAKIDLADEVLVLNVGGYIGESTRREVLYAQRRGKSVRYLELTMEPVDLTPGPFPGREGEKG